MTSLCCDRADVAFVGGAFFLRRGPGFNAAPAAVVTDARNVALDDAGFIRVVNDVDIHVPHSAVVEEMVAFPAPAFEAVAEVAEAVVNAAVKADDRPPISDRENEGRTVPTPEAGRPKKSRFGCQHPCTGHPEVLITVPIPVAWRPDVIVARARWLVVKGNFGRPESNRNADYYLRAGRRGRDCKTCQHSQENCEAQDYRVNCTS